MPSLSKVDPRFTPPSRQHSILLSSRFSPLVNQSNKTLTTHSVYLMHFPCIHATFLRLVSNGSFPSAIDSILYLGDATQAFQFNVFYSHKPATIQILCGRVLSPNWSLISQWWLQFNDRLFPFSILSNALCIARTPAIFIAHKVRYFMCLWNNYFYGNWFNIPVGSLSNLRWS